MVEQARTFAVVPAIRRGFYERTPAPSSPISELIAEELRRAASARRPLSAFQRYRQASRASVK
jgi:hypothetical protein